MLKALMLKELRETAWIALMALAAHLAFVANLRRLRRSAVLDDAGTSEKFPFSTAASLTSFCFISVALAVALGLRQTTVESSRGTWLFLLHRPASLWRVLAAKLAVGGGLYLLCGLIADLVLRRLGGHAGQARQPVSLVDDGRRLEGLGPDCHRLPGRLPGGDPAGALVRHAALALGGGRASSPSCWSSPCSGRCWALRRFSW